MEIIKRLYVHLILKGRFNKGKIQFKIGLNKYDKELKKQCLEKLKIYFALSEIEKIEKIVCHYFNQNKEQLHKGKQNRNLIKSRQIIMSFAKDKTKMILKDIGAYFGQGHCMVLWAVKVVNNETQTNKTFENDIKEIEKRL